MDRFDGVTTTLEDPKVAKALERMFAESAEQFASMRSGGTDFSRLESATAQERADAFSDYYLPVTQDAGRLLYALVRAARPATIVEFGMSLGISAIHLASAVRDNGSGRVVTTELSAAKVAAAKKTFTETGLDDLITVLEGDALTTLEKPRRAGGFRPARRLERALRSGARAARAAPVAGHSRRRRQHLDGRAGALPRLRPRPGQRLRERQLPGAGQRQHGDQLPRDHFSAGEDRSRCGRMSRPTASRRAPRVDLRGGVDGRAGGPVQLSFVAA